MQTNTARKLKVLVIDDDPSIVRIVETVLDKHLHDVIDIFAFTDPNEAREWIDANCCDIVISDIEMPEMDGLDILRFSKQRNAWTQVIFLTAHSTWSRIAEAVESGASDYLLKPIDHNELRMLVEQHCQRFTRWQAAVSATLRTSGVGDY